MKEWRNRNDDETRTGSYPPRGEPGRGWNRSCTDMSLRKHPRCKGQSRGQCRVIVIIQVVQASWYIVMDLTWGSVASAVTIPRLKMTQLCHQWVIKYPNEWSQKRQFKFDPLFKACQTKVQCLPSHQSSWTRFRASVRLLSLTLL